MNQSINPEMDSIISGSSLFQYLYPISYYHTQEAFNIVRKKCVNCTLHSGEGAGPESINDSIRHCGAHRIGHGMYIIRSLSFWEETIFFYNYVAHLWYILNDLGTRLGEDPTLLKYVIDRRIALECCITSNLQTKVNQISTSYQILLCYKIFSDHRLSYLLAYFL